MSNCILFGRAVLAPLPRDPEDAQTKRYNGAAHRLESKHPSIISGQHLLTIDGSKELSVVA